MKLACNKFAEYLVHLFGQRVAGFLHTLNDEIGDRTIATSGSINLVYGEDKIVENLLGLKFENKLTFRSHIEDVLKNVV